MTAVENHKAEDDFDLLCAQRRAWTEGRVALESLQGGMANPLPSEPLLSVRHARDTWAPALAALHLRAR